MADNGKGAGFFAVDRRTWARVCGLGLNSAVAYLILARGTGKSNQESAWSVQAIETYTGISRSRARAAISELLNDGAVRKLRDGTRPKYELAPWHVIAGTDPRRHSPSASSRLLIRRSGGRKSRRGIERGLPAQSRKVGFSIIVTDTIAPRRGRMQSQTGSGCPIRL